MCIFCDIIKGKIPSFKIYEDEYTYAFLDIAGDVYGHTLVIPKKHCENIFDADSETLSHVMNAVSKIANHYVDKCGFTGVNLINCSGKDAEQSVYHLHMHILPRQTDDNLKIYPTLSKQNFDMQDICDKLHM